MRALTTTRARTHAHTSITPQVEESPQMLMIKSYVALQDTEVVVSDQRTSQATIAALLRWWQLPEVGSAPQIKLLQVFQQLVRCMPVRVCMCVCCFCCCRCGERLVQAFEPFKSAHRRCLKRATQGGIGWPPSPSAPPLTPTQACPAGAVVSPLCCCLPVMLPTHPPPHPGGAQGGHARAERPGRGVGAPGSLLPGGPGHHQHMEVCVALWAGGGLQSACMLLAVGVHACTCMVLSQSDARA